MTGNDADLADRAEATARAVLADPTIPNRMREKALQVVAQAGGLRIMKGAIGPGPAAPGAGAGVLQDGGRGDPPAGPTENRGQRMDTSAEPALSRADALRLVRGLMDDLPEDPTQIGAVSVRRAHAHVLLARAAELGAMQQAAADARARAACAATDAARRPQFPPPRIVRGGRRLWLVCMGLLALVLVSHTQRSEAGVCRYEANAAASAVYEAQQAQLATAAAQPAQALAPWVADRIFTPPPTLNCRLDGLPMALLQAGLVSLVAAFASWAAYRALLWVVVGFRAG